MLSERDIELAHPDAFDFVFGNLPAANRAGFNRHLDSCPYCQKVVDEYSDIGQIIKGLPPHVEPPPDLEDRTVAAMVAVLAGQRAQTDRRSDPEDQAATSVRPDSRGPASGRRRDPGPAETAAPASGQGRHPGPAETAAPAAGPAGGHSAARVATLSRPPRCCRCRRRRCHHHRRHRRSAQPWRGPDHPSHSHSHSRDPAPCHRGGQADRRRRSQRASDGPAGWPKLDLRYDRPWPQGAARE